MKIECVIKFFFIVLIHLPPAWADRSAIFLFHAYLNRHRRSSVKFSTYFLNQKARGIADHIYMLT